MNTMRRPDKLPPVEVEYDLNEGRTSKRFDDAFAARRFYAKMMREGKNPKVKKATEEK